MGKNNKQRRAAKAKKRARRPSGPNARAESRFSARQDETGWASANRSDEHERVTALYGVNQLARQRQDDDQIADATNRLARCTPALVAREIERDFARVLPALWDGGWLPGEVLRQIKRMTSTNGERLASFAVAADHRGRGSETLHPKWKLHVDELSLPSGVRSGGWLQSRGLVESFTTAHHWSTVIDLASSVAFTLCSLGRLEQIIPPPGSSRSEPSIVELSMRAAGPILTKVRQLLAQAESTSFQAEAEAFTAKAQELMARHAIDAALVWAKEGREDAPTTIRIPLDDPYTDAKSLLITVVAEETHCRAVIHSRYAMASLVGFDGDLIWCETLYTSLLVQAQREMSRVGAGDRAGGRRRSRSYRSSFLTAYAERIGQRLAEVNAHVRDASAAAAEPVRQTDETVEPSNSALLPVLARRRSAVDDAIASQFGELADESLRGANDPQGWSAGWLAADRAQLTSGNVTASQAS